MAVAAEASSSSTQQPIRLLALRDARCVESTSSTRDAHLARSPRNPSTRRLSERDRRAGCQILSLARSPVSNARSTRTQLAAVSCSQPSRASLPRNSLGSLIFASVLLSHARSCPSSRVHSSLPGSTLRTTRLRTTTRLPLHSEHPGPPSRGGVGFPRAERSHQPRGPSWRSGGSVGTREPLSDVNWSAR